MVETIQKYMETTMETKNPTKNQSFPMENVTLRNILPTCGRLKEKGMDIHHRCYSCHAPVETIWHPVRDCPYLNSVQQVIKWFYHG